MRKTLKLNWRVIKGRVFIFGETIVYMKFYLEQSLIYCEICPKQQKSFFDNFLIKFFFYNYVYFH